MVIWVFNDFFRRLIIFSFSISHVVSGCLILFLSATYHIFLKVIDYCVDNGGCDNLTNCTFAIGGPAVCGPCPEGYMGTGDTTCTGK